MLRASKQKQIPLSLSLSLSSVFTQPSLIWGERERAQGGISVTEEVLRMEEVMMMGGESKSKRRYAVLLCGEDSEYVRKKHGGCFGVFVRMLAEAGETWDAYKVASGVFPEDDDLGLYDGFVITGSCSDAYGNDTWISDLLLLLKKLDSMNKKILGICFGHQILGRALGGKVSRSPTGWDIGVRTITLSSSSPLALSSLDLPAKLSIIECHRDEIKELPPKAEVIAWSDKTGIEMFRYGDHIMGIQGHPEYYRDILLNLIDRLIQRDYIMEDFAEEAREKAALWDPDEEAWKRVCVSFLKGRLR